jgi:DNA polymerase-3 subunit gamma/tau
VPPSHERGIVQSTPAVSGRQLSNSDDWIGMIGELGLRGPVRELAAHAGFIEYQGGVLQLSLSEDKDYLRTEGGVQQLTEALENALRCALRLQFRNDRSATDTFHERHRRNQDSRQAEAERTFAADPSVQRLLSQYEGRIVPGSVRPIDAP